MFFVKFGDVHLVHPNSSIMVFSRHAWRRELLYFRCLQENKLGSIATLHGGTIKILFVFICVCLLVYTSFLADYYYLGRLEMINN